MPQKSVCNDSKRLQRTSQSREARRDDRRLLGEVLVNLFRTVLIGTCQVLLTFALLHSGIVPEQLIETAGEGERHE